MTLVSQAFTNELVKSGSALASLFLTFLCLERLVQIRKVCGLVLIDGAAESENSNLAPPYKLRLTIPTTYFAVRVSSTVFPMDSVFRILGRGWLPS